MGLFSRLFGGRTFRPPAQFPTRWTEGMIEDHATLWRGHLWGDQEIVGESNYQDQLRWLTGPTATGECNTRALATLEFEPTNPHDKSAIKVTIDGLTVGYIARGEQASVRSLMHYVRRTNDIVTCPAKYVGGTDGKMIGVYLSLWKRD